MGEKIEEEREEKMSFREALPREGAGGGGVGGLPCRSSEFKTTRIGDHKCLTSLSEIERKFFVFVGILEKGNSNAL